MFGFLMINDEMMKREIFFFRTKTPRTIINQNDNDSKPALPRNKCCFFYIIGEDCSHGKKKLSLPCPREIVPKLGM